MPLLKVCHVTTYRYRQPVAFGEHRIMVRPRDGHDQRLIATDIDITPVPASLRWVHDVFGNCVALARFDRRAAELRFDCRSTLDHRPVNPLEFALDERAATYPFTYSPEDMPDLSRLIERHTPDPDCIVEDWARGFIHRGRPTLTEALLAEMTLAIHEGFTYARRDAAGVQDPAATLASRSGTCRDFALLMMEAVRALGFAARFVSGYLHSPGAKPDGTGGGRIGAGATHAWLQVFLPGAGWVEFDPTNGIVGSNRGLIRVAVARDPRQALPLSGTWTGFPSDSLGMAVTVRVTAEGDAELPAAPPLQNRA
jgi:transglutaminase-like putative cysteine protease